ncbi:hypothetical protein DFS34DRAFT_627293 [Phlyctochytrium arcticum]|nr:hypothetical protein DFS34DRAFT_627293 [Phlyctochytrium arcticum]
MEQMRSTLKLKQQQQAIIDSRQNAHRGPMSADTRASTGGVASSPRESFGGKGASSRQPPSPRYRNSKNLTIWTGESAASGSSSRGGAMTAPVDGPAHAPPTVLHPGRRHDSPSNASLLSPRHLNPAPGKSSKIGSRGMEASRYNIPLHSNSISASNQQLVSPRAGEFPSRELPLPPHMHQHRDRDASDRETHGRSPLPIAQAHNGSSGSSKHLPSIAPPPQSPSTGYGTGPGGLHSNSALPFSRSNFLGLCESLFDQTDESFRLQSTLRDQIRRSTAMLQTLQSSGQMIEGLVRSHFREMQVQYGEKFGFALTDLNRRLASVEEKLGLSNAASNQRGGGGGGGGGASNAGSTTSNEPSSSSIPSHVAHWGFRGGPPSANVNGTGFSFGLAREEGGDGKAATPGVEGLLRGLMERLEKLEGKSGDTAATGDGEIVESKSE